MRPRVLTAWLTAHLLSWSQQLSSERLCLCSPRRLWTTCRAVVDSTTKHHPPPTNRTSTTCVVKPHYLPTFNRLLQTHRVILSIWKVAWGCSKLRSSTTQTSTIRSSKLRTISLSRSYFPITSQLPVIVRLPPMPSNKAEITPKQRL